ncbi:MAG: hypothetical protein C0594_16770 [Marinilabiliales bacterium]|nr:MAG: hypothetical protein C0594_16770 [Marinilabiliales bacterium]
MQKSIGKLFIIFSLSFVFTGAFSQTLENSENTKHLASYSKGNHSEIMPNISWPIQSISANGKYQYSVPVLISDLQLFETSDGKIAKVELNASLADVFLVNDNGKINLYISSYFPPSNEKLLSTLFYELGVENILLEGNKTDVISYTNDYKKLAHKKLRETRIYLTE